MKEKIKTFEDACMHLGIKPNLPAVEGLFTDHQKAVVAFYKLSVIASALNGGWKPNWDDLSECKYYPWWFKGVLAGVAARHSSYSLSGSNSFVGARLFYKTRELAEYAGDHFYELYQDFLLFA